MLKVLVSHQICINLHSNAQLFSSVNNWGPYYIEQVQKVMDGKWSTGRVLIIGQEIPGRIGDDFLVLTEFKNMPADVAKAATAARDGIAKGSLNIFEGPMMDNQQRDSQIW